VIARVRPYRPADPAWVIEQHARIYAAEHAFDAHFADTIHHKMGEWLARADPLKQMWIAECDGDPAGCIAISDAGDASAFLNFVLVLPDYRGQRLGRQLLDTALAHARSCGQRLVRLETYQCLAEARQLYRSSGFRCQETRAPVALYGQAVVSEFWSLAL